MSVTYSSNMSLEKPTVNNSNNVWGTELNRTIDLVDAALLSNNFAVGTHSGLNFYYKNGRIMNGSTIVNVAASYVTLTNNTTNYVEVNSAGTVSKNTTGFSIGAIPLYTVITLSSVITTVTDCRSYLYPNISEMVKVDSSGNTTIGDDTNYTQFSDSGKMVMSGNNRVRKKLAIPASQLRVGTTSPTGTITDYVYGQAYTINDNAFDSIPLPPDVDVSDSLVLTVTWLINEAYATNSGEIKWQCEYKFVSAGDVVSAVSVTTTALADENIPAVAKTLTTSTIFTAVTGSYAAGDILSLKFSRVALTGGNNPTAEPVTIVFELAYTSNQLGNDL